MPVGSLRDLCLLCAKTPNHPAWEELLSKLEPTAARSIYRVARQFGTPRLEDVEDMLQELAAKLASGGLRNIPTVEESKILAYISVAAANVARDHYRVAFAGKRDQSQTESLEHSLIETVCGSAGPDASRQLLLQSIDRHLEADTRGRSVFWLYYRQGYTASEIARIPAVGLTTKGVETLILRLTRAVRDRLKPPCSGKDEGNAPPDPS